MPSPYSPKAIANYFLNLAEENDGDLRPLKLQKLIYFAHGWYLAIYDKPLIDESVQAWKFGPVIPSIYHEFKEFGRYPINRPALVLKGLKLVAPNVDDKSDKEFLDKIWEVFSGFTGVQLSNMTHEGDSPWHQTWFKDGAESNKSIPIDDEKIKQYFNSLGQTA